VHDEQIGSSHRSSGLPSKRGRHHPAVAGEPAGAAADLMNCDAIFDGEPFTMAIIKRQDRRGEGP
jgi:hypothetical protein